MQLGCVGPKKELLPDAVRRPCPINWMQRVESSDPGTLMPERGAKKIERVRIDMSLPLRTIAGFFSRLGVGSGFTSALTSVNAITPCAAGARKAS